MFSSVGDRGGNAIKASGTAITQNPTSDVAVGNLLAVFVAWDNNNASTGDGPLSQQIQCTDSVGNVYREMFSGQATGANLRAHGCIFVTIVDVAITTGDTVTVLNTTSAKVAKAVSMWEFAIDTGYLIGTTDSGPIMQLTSGADPEPISISGMTSREYLLLHVLATEGPNTDTYTWDPDYTQITQQGTSGGVDDTNMTVNGGFRIATLTGDTVDITANTPTRDYTQGLQAIWGYLPTLDFPNQPILDNFNRADVDPLPQPPWRATSAGTGTRLLRNASNAAQRGEATGSGAGGGDWWDTNFPENDQEAYCTLVNGPGGNGQYFGVIVNGNGNNASNRGGLAYMTWVQGGNSDFVFMGQLGISDAPSPLWGLAWVEMAAGYKMGLRRISIVQEYWVDKGSGWYFVQGIEKAGTPTGSGYIGLTTSLNTGRMDDFGGGVVVPPVTLHLLPLLHVGT